MALKGSPSTGARPGVLDKFIDGLPPEDRETVIGYLSDPAYGPTSIAEWLQENGYQGSEKPIYTWRKKNLS